MKLKKRIKNEIESDLTAGAIVTGMTIGATERKIEKIKKDLKKKMNI
jgi:hypothetical protein